MEFLFCLLGYMVQVVGVLMAVAYFTLYERKLLSYSQNRVGPNKVSILGLLQPISDAMKLFNKERMLPYKSYKLIFVVSPIFTLAFPMFMWILQPFWFSGMEFKFTWLLVFCMCTFNVYFGFLSGWVSKSKYSVLGSFRAVSQMISYELALAFVVIIYSLFMQSYSLGSFNDFSLFFLFYPLGICWFMVCLSESQRTPFDLAEGESELVSGFNTEYSASYFALLFLGEYMSMLFMCILSVFLMFGCSLDSLFFFFIFWGFFTLFIWSRCTFPRMRYDSLMFYLWKSILPFLIIVLLLTFLLKLLN